VLGHVITNGKSNFFIDQRGPVLGYFNGGVGPFVDRELKKMK
jgi:hypothetical protein